MKMKILMLNPPFLPKYSRQSRSPCVSKGGTFYYPYYLAYGTGALEKDGFNVKLLDAVANDWSHQDTLNFVRKLKPDLTVIDTSTPSIKNDVMIADKIKELLPHTHLCLGGIHAGKVPDETFQISENIDSIIRKEYDFTISDLAKTLEDNKKLETVDGISFRNNGKIIHNKPRSNTENLDTLPFVSKIYLKHFGKEGIKKYFYASVHWPQITILTARGCPYNCSFCNIPSKNSYRTRTPEDVVEESEFIQSKLSFVKEIMIEDDTFPANKKRTLEICELFKKRKITLPWSCNARVNTDEETLKAMKNANCRLMCVGFESESQDMLNAIHKGTTKRMQFEFMKRVRKIGLLINGCFILGLPNDTIKTIRKTIEMAKELNPDTAQFYPLMVYPGTEAFEWAKRNNYLLTTDYEKWITKEGWHDTTISRPDLPKEDVLRMCDLARKEYYLRPKYIMQKFIQIITNLEEAKRTLISFKTFSNWLLKKGLKTTSSDFSGDNNWLLN
jgi:radical SAM superfamily enzyme YgiQ (UPF0313 family)